MLRTPAPLIGALGAMNCVVRIATNVDAESACAVLRNSITERCTQDHRNDPEILDEWLGNKTPQNVANWFADPNHFSLVAEFDGAVQGVAMMSTVGEVMLCYVTSAATSKGVGKMLLAALETEATRRNIEVLNLESTATARQFYRRHGFVDIAEPKEVFGVRSYPMRKVPKAKTEVEHDA